MFEMTFVVKTTSTPALFKACRDMNTGALKVFVYSGVYSLASFKKSVHRCTLSGLHPCMESVAETDLPIQLMVGRAWFKNWVGLNVALTKM